MDTLRQLNPHLRYNEGGPFKADFFIDIIYGLKTGATIRTNVKPELVDEMLAEYVRGCAGKGADKRKAVEKEEYRVRVECDLSFDVFRVASDAGNDSLTDGIVASTIGNWKMQPEKSLEKRAESGRQTSAR